MAMQFPPLVPVDQQSGGVKSDGMQHPYGWTKQRRGFRGVVPDLTQNHDFYYRILDKQGNPMLYRPLSGGYHASGSQDGDKFDIDLVVKGEDVGGTTGVNDIDLYSFCFEEYTVNAVDADFLAPDRSILVYMTADKFNPALPPVPVYFRVRYTAIDATNPNPVKLKCWLEGFQPPVG